MTLSPAAPGGELSSTPSIRTSVTNGTNACGKIEFNSWTDQAFGRLTVLPGINSTVGNFALLLCRAKHPVVSVSTH